MCKLLSLVALVVGIWLVYLGYERQQSLAGKAENTMASIGQKIDGGDHTTSYVKYYVAGAVLVLGGSFGLGIVRR
jgi:hypothetical protein